MSANITKTIRHDGPSAIRASTYKDKYNLNETKPQDLATSHQEIQGMRNMLNVNTGMKPAYPHLGTPTGIKGKITDKVGTCILKKKLRDICHSNQMQQVNLVWIMI